MKKLLILMTLFLFGGLSLPGTAPAIPVFDSQMISPMTGFLSHSGGSAFNDNLNFITGDSTGVWRGDGYVSSSSGDTDSKAKKTKMPSAFKVRGTQREGKYQASNTVFAWNKDIRQAKEIAFSDFKIPGLRFVTQELAEWKSLFDFPMNVPQGPPVFYPGNVNNQFNADGINSESFLNEPEGFFDGITDTNAPIPEPATLFLLGSGMIVLAAHSRRKLKHNE